MNNAAVREAVSAGLDLRQLQGRGFSGITQADEDRMLLAEEVNRLRTTLAAIACFPIPEQGDMPSRNMRLLAQQCLAGPNVR